jgi:hypothetical protein
MADTLESLRSESLRIALYATKMTKLTEIPAWSADVARLHRRLLTALEAAERERDAETGAYAALAERTTDEIRTLQARVAALEAGLRRSYKMLRCLNTKNLCGTDTWPKDWTCPCASCVSWLAFGALLAAAAPHE